MKLCEGKPVAATARAIELICPCRELIMPVVSEPKNIARLIVRRLAAAALVLWLAGVGCFFGCETGVASAAEGDKQESAARADSCPAFAGHDCCHKKAKARSSDGGGTNARQTPTPLPRTGGCPLRGQSADTARKLSVADARLAVAVVLPKFISHANTHPRLQAHRPRVPDRGSTHLRCCVFLI